MLLEYARQHHLACLKARDSHYSFSFCIQEEYAIDLQIDALQIDALQIDALQIDALQIDAHGMGCLRLVAFIKL